MDIAFRLVRGSDHESTSFFFVQYCLVNLSPPVGVVNLAIKFSKTEKTGNLWTIYAHAIFGVKTASEGCFDRDWASACNTQHAEHDDCLSNSQLTYLFHA